MAQKVIAPLLRESNNSQGLLYEFASRSDIKGYLLVALREDGNYERVCTDLSTEQQSMAVSLANTMLHNRIMANTT